MSWRGADGLKGMPSKIVKAHREMALRRKRLSSRLREYSAEERQGKACRRAVESVISTTQRVHCPPGRYTNYLRSTSYLVGRSQRTPSNEFRRQRKKNATCRVGKPALRPMQTY